MEKSRVEVTLTRCVQDSHEYGSNDEHMVSRVFLQIGRPGGQVQDTFADVKQTVGASYDAGPLEVGRPQAYKGPLDYARFQEEVGAYYRSLVGSTASAIKLAPGSTARMQGNVFNKRHAFLMDVEEGGGGW